MTKWGIHLPNNNPDAASRPWDLDALLEMGFSHFVLLHQQANLARSLREASPKGTILVRFYLENWSMTDPHGWADFCGAEYAKDRGGWSLKSVGAHVIPANEMNLAVEGGGDAQEWYKAIDAWLVAWVREFQTLTSIPYERLHWPALAYGHNEEIYGFALCQQSLSLYGVQDCHPYWFKVEQALDTFYGHRFEIDHGINRKPIFISEAGNFETTRVTSPEEYVLWYESLYDYDYVLGGCPFIWDSPDSGHDANNISRSPALVARLRNAYKEPISQEETVADNPLKTYASWSIARINIGQDPTDVIAFAEHIRRTGGDPAKLELYGCPATGALPFSAAALMEHLEAVQALLKPAVTISSRVDQAQELLRPFS